MNTTQIFASGPATPAGKETHVAVVVDDSIMTLYIDGSQVAQKNLGGRSLEKAFQRFRAAG